MTIGDHLRKRRLDLGLLQREVADRIGAIKDSVYLWEANRVAPTLPLLPKIIEFLGYCPYDPDWSLRETLTMARKYCGISQEALARRLGVDPGTLAKWERGKDATRKILDQIIELHGQWCQSGDSPAQRGFGGDQWFRGGKDLRAREYASGE